MGMRSDVNTDLLRTSGRTVVESKVFVVDDDSVTRESIGFALTCAGYASTSWGTATEAIESCEPAAPGCFLLDIFLPDMNGLELYQQLFARGCRQPFFVISGHGEIPMAVKALQDGAMDFLEKPFERSRLLECVEAAFRDDAEWRQVQDAIDALTNRERQLLPLIAEGKLSKEVSKIFDISPRTVEVHRRNIMQKMGAESVAKLVRTLTTHFLKRNETTDRVTPTTV